MKSFTQYEPRPMISGLASTSCFLRTVCYKMDQLDTCRCPRLKRPLTGTYASNWNDAWHDAFSLAMISMATFWPMRDLQARNLFLSGFWPINISMMSFWPIRKLQARNLFSLGIFHYYMSMTSWPENCGHETPFLSGFYINKYSPLFVFWRIRKLRERNPFSLGIFHQ